MKSVIIHADGRRTDLAGIVDPITYAELENLRCPRHSPVLWCGGCGGSIYIRHGATRKDELFGAHHERRDCDEALVIRKSQMSDEHKRQAEYHATAAQRAGYTADLEVTTTGHTRVDVVIDGRIGIEVQRSALKKSSAIDRTARSVAAGLSSVTWFTDRNSSPPWTGHVPGYRPALIVDWSKTTPPPGTVAAAGLRIVEAIRCGTRAPCPHQRYGSCGRFVEWDSPWQGIYVDDVVEGLTAASIRPVRLGRNVQLLSAASIALYEELTGIKLGYNPGPPKITLPPSDHVECALPLRISSGAPPPVREWLMAEQARVQREREERARAEREEQQRREQAERERAALAERARLEREERAREYQEMLEARRQREEHLRRQQMLRAAREQLQEQARQEVLTRQAEQAREACLQYDRRIRERIHARRPTHCDVPGCTTPGQLYAGGFRCDQHKPRPYVSANQGDGTD